jgi:hypothetical protein
VLLPAFGMDAMRGYHPRMLDVATQLMLKWERLNPDDTVDVPAEMTRLTLDTIALCGFDYRFNSFYRDTPHPFVLAMLNTLEVAQASARELPIQAKLNRGRAKKVRADQDLMVATVRRIIEERRKSGQLGKVNDLLDRMLTGVDRQSGEALDETNIIAQCLTFLIAGHETTSGLLSFALYALIKNPKVLGLGYEEVDRVLGADVNALPTYAYTHQLPYVSQILEETLRLWPTAPAFTRRPAAEGVHPRYAYSRHHTSEETTGGYALPVTPTRTKRLVGCLLQTFAGRFRRAPFAINNQSGTYGLQTNARPGHSRKRCARHPGRTHTGLPAFRNCVSSWRPFDTPRTCGRSRRRAG